MKIIPKLDEIKIVPKLNEFKIVPKLNEGDNKVVVSQEVDPQKRSRDQQIDDIRNSGDFNSDTDRVEVDMKESADIVTEALNVNNDWVKLFNNLLVYGGGQGVMRDIPYRMAKAGFLLTAKDMNQVTQNFKNNKKLQNPSWVMRAAEIIKNAGVGKVISDDEGNITHERPAAIEKNPQTILAIKNFINALKEYERSIGKPTKSVEKLDHLFDNEGNAERIEKGIGSTANYNGILDISKDKNVQKTDIDNLLKSEIERLKKPGEKENPAITDRIKQLITQYRITSQSILKKYKVDPNNLNNENIYDVVLVRLKKEIDKTTNPIEKEKLQKIFDTAKERTNNEIPENLAGNDLVDQKLLAIYSARIGKPGYLKSALDAKDAKGQNVNLKQQVRGDGGKFSGSLLSQLKQIAAENEDEEMLNMINNIRTESKSNLSSIKKIIITERQAKLLSQLKENIATNVTKDLGYRCPPNHRKIKNIDKTDYRKKLEDERNKKPNIAQKVTKDKKSFDYKTPNHRKKTLSTSGKEIEKKEILNNFFVKENKALTKKGLIEYLIRNEKIF